MRTILVATDFSTRSDRALRRAVLLARQIEARLVLLHVVDEDRPRRLVEAERREAETLLAEWVATLAGVDQVACRWSLRGGEAFVGILAAAEEVGADLIVLGPPRRQLLRGVLTGTTAERVIREGARPVLVANGMPSALYRRVALAVDFSPGCARAAEVIGRLGLDERTTLLAVHAFDAPALPLFLRTPGTAAAVEDYLAGVRREAAAELARFLAEVGLVRARRVLVPVRDGIADAIATAAAKLRADLLVLASRGKVGLGKLVLGSVAEALLRRAELDVLVVPPEPPEAPHATAAGP